jgi:inosine-uridine nucleoside N-ribohydrolase
MWIQDALRFYMDFHKRQEGLDGCIVNDVLPIAELVQPGVLSFEEQRLTVDVDDAEHRGHTRVDPEGARVKVATRVELGPIRRLLSERVFRWAARAATAPIASEEVQV